MQLALYVLIVATLASFLIGAFRLIKVARSKTLAAPPDGDLDIGRYRPMERLLRAEDERYAVRCGLDRGAVRRLRADRRRVFRGYLQALTVDFGRVTGMLRSAILHADVPRTDLKKALFRAQARFAFARVAIECQLALHAFGVNSVQMDVRPLVAALEYMREQADLSANWAAAAA